MSEELSLRSLVDDPRAILDSDTILRVVQPSFFEGREVQSNAFQDQSLAVANHFGLAAPCASVNVRRIWERSGADMRALLGDFPDGSGLVEVRVEDARRLRTGAAADVPQGFMLDERPGRPWHAVMFSVGRGQRPKGAMRALVDVCWWFWHPDDD
jgi:hypothetical protein